MQGFLDNKLCEAETRKIKTSIKVQHDRSCVTCSTKSVISATLSSGKFRYLYSRRLDQQQRAEVCLRHTTQQSFVWTSDCVTPLHCRSASTKINAGNLLQRGILECPKHIPGI